MYDCQKLSKIENEKIQRWKLATSKYEIIYQAEDTMYLLIPLLE